MDFGQIPIELGDVLEHIDRVDEPKSLARELRKIGNDRRPERAQGLLVAGVRFDAFDGDAVA